MDETHDQTHGVGVGETMMDITADMTKLDESKMEETTCKTVDDTELGELLEEAKSKSLGLSMVAAEVEPASIESKSAEPESTEPESTEKAWDKKLLFLKT